MNISSLAPSKDDDEIMEEEEEDTDDEEVEGAIDNAGTGDVPSCSSAAPTSKTDGCQKKSRLSFVFDVEIEQLKVERTAASIS